MRVALIGNLTPPHSTETHLARAWEHNGHEVDRWQENDLRTWENLGEIPQTNIDLIMWVRTGWDWSDFGVTEAWAHSRMRRMIRFARDNKIPVISYHLDIWVGLAREHLLDTEPFFETDLVVTADGGHPEVFARKGISHVWFPPGVSLAETEPGMFRSDLASPIAFVGSHNGDYHPESTHRHELVRWLKQNFTRDCAFWPKPGEHALRGSDLRDLYASTQVNIGDSCFAGTGLANYWSDRIPETLGRGGFLLHPDVPGLEAHFALDGFTHPPGGTGDRDKHGWEHLWTWPAFDWDTLGRNIEWALTHPEERDLIARSGKAHVIAHHTYEVRMEQLVELLYERKLLKRPRKGKST